MNPTINSHLLREPPSLSFGMLSARGPFDPFSPASRIMPPEERSHLGYVLPPPHPALQTSARYWIRNGDDSQLRFRRPSSLADWLEDLEALAGDLEKKRGKMNLKGKDLQGAETFYQNTHRRIKTLRSGEVSLHFMKLQEDNLLKIIRNHRYFVNEQFNSLMMEHWEERQSVFKDVYRVWIARGGIAPTSQRTIDHQELIPAKRDPETGKLEFGLACIRSVRLQRWIYARFQKSNETGHCRELRNFACEFYGCSREFNKPSDLCNHLLEHLDENFDKSKLSSHPGKWNRFCPLALGNPIDLLAPSTSVTCCSFLQGFPALSLHFSGAHGHQFTCQLFCLDHGRLVILDAMHY
ncbi:hypothetical protein T439DRAFT_226112 [Meredithblackwellia eburnea MCA 4105]